jgi:uncharacterized membrane protein HdeD (DUF308 family)
MANNQGKKSPTSAQSGAPQTQKQSVADVKKTMNKKIGNVTVSRIVLAVALIIIGVLFCALRASMLSILLTLVGVVLIALGIYDIVRKKYVKGAIEAAAGLVIIVCGWTIVEITLLILGIVFIAYAVYSIIESAPKIKESKGANKILTILNPILLLVFGILLVVSYWALGDVICIIIGIIAIVDGISLLIRTD